uniref:Large ribosomal subunit protein uL3m n=1 Tax=Grammatophora oceanica TaxID=210454 RepID=A0A7S1VTG3_9STRA
MRKKWNPKDHGWDDFPHGEIQTLNAPPDMTEAEMIQLMEDELAKLEEEKKKMYTPNWKPGMRKRPLLISYKKEDFEYEYNPEVTPRWQSHLDKRCGALAIKVGMIPYWDDWGEYHCCTILSIDTNVVIGHKTEAKHGYMAVVLGGGERKAKNVRHTVRGQYKNLLDHAPYLMKEFRVSSEDHLPPIGSSIHARHFTPGQAVDISGITKGKGFQGGMKRHGFSGQPASHGVSLSHRAIGAVGARKPGKVFKGKKMPGRMGGDRKTIQNNRILKIDRGRNLLYVKGCIPGNRGHFVEVKDAFKRPLWGTTKVLGELDRPPVPTFDYDPAIDGTMEKGHEEVMPLSEIDPMIPPEIIPPPPGKY